MVVAHARPATTAGFLAVGDTCACDINGTFAVRSQLSLSWPANTPFESGSDSTYGWSIERHSYGKDGNLQLELISCGAVRAKTRATSFRSVSSPPKFGNRWWIVPRWVACTSSQLRART